MPNEQDNKDKDKSDKNFFIFVDGEKFEPSATPMTPNQIIIAATGLDASMHYLKRMKQGGGESYQDKGDDPIHLEKADRFQVISTGPMTVSYK